MNKKMKKDVKLSPSAIIAVGFLLLILTATLLLMLPISAQNRQSTPLLTSLFTATERGLRDGSGTGGHRNALVALRTGRADCGDSNRRLRRDDADGTGFHGTGQENRSAPTNAASGERRIVSGRAASFVWCALRCGEQRSSRAAARCC